MKRVLVVPWSTAPTKSAIARCLSLIRRSGGEACCFLPPSRRCVPSSADSCLCCTGSGTCTSYGLPALGADSLAGALGDLGRAGSGRAVDRRLLRIRQHRALGGRQEPADQHLV